MNVKERYNTIIYKIEELVTEAEYMDNLTISKKAFETASYYLRERDKNSIFLFLIGSTVEEYIRERRLMAAYKCIATHGRKGYEKAICLTNVQNYSSIYRAFQRRFGVKITTVAQDKDLSRLEPVKDWDYISQEGKDFLVQFADNTDVLQESRFGIPKERYIRAKYAEDMQSFYGLNDVEAELAFDLAESRDMSMKDTFEYVYNYVWPYLDEREPGDNQLTKRDSRIKDDLLNEDTLYLYFEQGFSFEDILTLLILKETECIDKPLKECELLYLQGLAIRFGDDCPGVFGNRYKSKRTLQYMLTQYNKAYQYYMERKTDELTEYDFALYMLLYANRDDMGFAWNNLKTGNKSYRHAKQNYWRIMRRGEAWKWTEEDELSDVSVKLLLEDCSEDSTDFDYEPEDMDDLEYNQDLYMPDELIEEFDICDEDILAGFDVEEFERLCDLEMSTEFVEESIHSRAFKRHFNLNVEED